MEDPMSRLVALVLVCPACGSGEAVGPGDVPVEPAGTSEVSVEPVRTGEVSVESGGCEIVSDLATCVRVRVACPAVEDLHALVTVTELPDSQGTVVLHGGAGGTAAFDQGFVPALIGRGFRVVQIAWEGDWEATGGATIKDAACRPATAFAWVFEEYHLADRSQGYCALGHSGGSAAVGYALSHYGAGEYLDHALLSAGPVMSRIDAACDPVTSGFGELSERESGCEAFPLATFVYSDFTEEFVEGWLREEACGAPYGDLEDPAALLEQSILSTGATLSYPLTRLDTWWCEDDQWGASGQGTFFADEVESELVRHCATGCGGEMSWTNPVEFVAMVDTVVTQCVPRHGDR